MQSAVSAIIDNKGAEVATTTPGATVREAVRAMNERHIGALVVLDQGELAGIFTERDVLTRVVAAERDPAHTFVAEVMTERLVTIGLETTVEHAMRVMTERRCRHLPVLAGGRVAGMISIGDVTKWMVRNQKAEIDALVRYIHGAYPG